MTRIPKKQLDSTLQVQPTEGAFVDGDKTKLDGIETGAEVNTVDSVNTKTGAVVLNPDDLDDTSTTHKFTTAGDISKLAGIEALADVTDTANVTSAGALMDSELTDIASVKALNQGVATTDSPTFAGATFNGTLNTGFINTSVASGDALSLNGTGTNNTILRFKDDGTEKGAIFYLNGGTTMVVRSQTGIQLASDYGTTGRYINFANSNFYPTVDSVTTLGTSSLYWSNTYTDRLYLNSTAYLDGGTAGKAALSGVMSIITTSSTLPSLYIEQNDSTNDPMAVYIKNSGNGEAFRFEQNAVLGTSKTCFAIYSNQAHVSSDSYLLKMENASATSTIPMTYMSQSANAANLILNNSHTGSDAHGLQIRFPSGASAKFLEFLNNWSGVFTVDAAGKIYTAAEIEIDGALNHDGSTVGFYGTAPVAQQTGVAVTAAGIHAALVNLGLITA